ncbi:MAG TPA: hypothetical protein VGL51_11640 [Solirubrobacteraceae bacterium]
MSSCRTRSGTRAAAQCADPARAGAASCSARLGIAVTRGLLLGLPATRDVDGVNAAMDAFIDVYESWLARFGDRPGPG